DRHRVLGRASVLRTELEASGEDLATNAAYTRITPQKGETYGPSGMDRRRRHTGGVGGGERTETRCGEADCGPGVCGRQAQARGQGGCRPGEVRCRRGGRRGRRRRVF